MVSGSWMDNTGRYRKFGTLKAVPSTGGDYMSFGSSREAEFTIDLTTLTTTPLIINDNFWFPQDTFIEEVIVDTEIGATGGTSFSMGTIANDRSTVISNTTFLAATVIADHTTAGQKKSYTVGVATVGAGVGSTIAQPAYITALAAGTYTAGRVKVRIRYRTIATITQ